MVRQPINIIFLLIFLLAAVSGCRPADTAWETVKQRGVLRVGLDPTFPPFENADSGELHGIDVDLARALAKELGVEVEFVYFGFDGLYDALATKQIDILLSALVVDISKTRDFAYSDPYFNAGQYLFIHQDDADPRTRSGSWSTAVELGSEGHVQAISWSRQYPEMDIIPLPTADDALWIVTQREAQAALVDQISGRLFQRDHPDLRMITQPVTVEPYAIVTRQDDQTLLLKVNEALAILIDNGTLDMIIEKGLDSSPSS